MLVELVRTQTEDGMRLDGALALPTSTSNHRCVDAVLCLHGAGSNFYGASTLHRSTQPLLDLGLAVLHVNTRGHDAMNTSSSLVGVRRNGAAFEIIDESQLDINAWLQFLTKRELPRVALLGHSLGALKAVYYQVHQPSDAIPAVIAVSPPQLSYNLFQNSVESGTFIDLITTAEKLVAEGKGSTIMDVTFPVPLLISADTYVDKYGKGERYNIYPSISQLPCPALFCFGEKELSQGGVAFSGLDQLVHQAADGAASPLDVITIPNANHFYIGAMNQLAKEIANWIAKM